MKSSSCFEKFSIEVKNIDFIQQIYFSFSSRYIYFLPIESFFFHHELIPYVFQSSKVFFFISHSTFEWLHFSWTAEMCAFMVLLALKLFHTFYIQISPSWTDDMCFFKYSCEKNFSCISYIRMVLFLNELLINVFSWSA